MEKTESKRRKHGGLAARGGRCQHSCRALVDGFRPFVDPAIQVPIIVTFHAPDDPNHDFKRFYQEVKMRGYVLYRGKLTEVDTVRVGCIGRFGEAGIPGAVAAIADTLKGMGRRRTSAEAAA
jgi:2-aminoethylphosphonate-pyruvate transaminase